MKKVVEYQITEVDENGDYKDARHRETFEEAKEEAEEMANDESIHKVALEKLTHFLDKFGDEIRRECEEIIIKYVFEDKKYVVKKEDHGYVTYQLKSDGGLEHIHDETEENLQTMYDSVQNVADEIIEYNPPKQMTKEE